MARTLVPKPKQRRKVPIPAELREAMREAFDIIKQAKRNPEIELDYDDAIQGGDGVLCGGRCGKKPRPYLMTYYPTGDSQKGLWFLALHHTEIEDIGDGRLAELAMYCCTSPDCRTKFREETQTCFYCDYEEVDHDSNSGEKNNPS